ncbi:MAG: hypothetical protein L0Y50_11190 [Beijerinckiaceae bacterium]|nr:hypothetical protein [Beijerinckiaceae bacterium]MCI0736813.1 hypothetical protein [Beijerinckiaceae bacterium]
MHNSLRCAVTAAAAFSLTLAYAHAGPCSNEIARIEEVMADPGPDIGPTNPQSLGAQLHRQPTPSSVARAEKRADARYKEAMARARALDAKDDPQCMSAVKELKELIGMQ